MSVVIIIFCKGFARPRNQIMVQQHPCLFCIRSVPLHNPHTPQPSDWKAKCRDACCTMLGKSYSLFFVKRINKETLCRNGLA